MDKQICCKDCKFYVEDQGYCNIPRISSSGIVLIDVTADYYCAKAKEKDDEE